MQAPAKTSAIRIAPQLENFVAIQILLTIACLASEVYCLLKLHLGRPYNYPILDASHSFDDFNYFIEKFHFFRDPAFYKTGITFMYPAPMAVVYEFFFLFRSHALVVFLGFILGSFAIAAILLVRALHQRGVSWSGASIFIVGSLVLSYPMWFDYKQANLEIGVWLFVALGVWSFCNDKGYTAATCFGIASSMKLFPFIYLALFLAKRKYREMLLALLVAAGTTIASLWSTGPCVPEAWRRTQAGLAEFRTAYMLHFRQFEVGSDHSLYAVYKRFVPHLPPPEQLGHILNAYFVCAALVALSLYFLIIKRLPLINQVLCLCVASILLPPVSYDYTLIHLYIPWALLVLFAQDQWNAGRKIPGLTAAFVCFAILASPETEFILHRESFGGQIKAATLIVLIYISLKYPFESKQSPWGNSPDVEPDRPLDIISVPLGVQSPTISHGLSL